MTATIITMTPPAHDELLLCDESVSLATPQKQITALPAVICTMDSQPTTPTSRSDITEAHEFALEAIKMRLLREASGDYIRDCDYLVDVQTHGMDATWRLKMCRWMFDTAKAFDLTQDAVGCAVHFLDQYLSQHSVDKVLLQLLCMVCMYVSSKMHESQPITLEEMELLCEYKFTKDQILSLEAQLLEALQWKLNPPVAFTFARDFIALVDPVSWNKDKSTKLEPTVMALVQAATEEYASLHFPPSVVGIAAVQLVAGAQMKPSLGSAVTKALALFQLQKATAPSRQELSKCNAFLRKIYLTQFQLQQAPLPQLLSAADDDEDEEDDELHPRIDSPTSVEEYFEPRHTKTSPALQHLTAPAAATTTAATDSPASAKRARLA